MDKKFVKWFRNESDLNRYLSENSKIELINIKIAVQTAMNNSKTSIYAILAGSDTDLKEELESRKADSRGSDSRGSDSRRSDSRGSDSRRSDSRRTDSWKPDSRGSDSRKR